MAEPQVKNETKQQRFLIYKPENLIEDGHFLSETFKTKLFDNNTTKIDKVIKEKLGEPHPFDYSLVEQVAMKFGIIPATTDKIVDFTLGPGYQVTSEDEKEVEILTNFEKESGLKNELRPWFNVALLKGTSYLEIPGFKDDSEIFKKTKQFVKVANTDTIYVQRDEFGVLLGYNQFVGNSINRVDDNSIIPLDKETIIQLDINKIGHSAYGIGIIYASLPIIDDFLNSQSSAHKLMKRKANSPLHFTVGNVEKDDYPEQSEIDNVGAKLQYMSNSTEYVTGPNVQSKVLDFGDVAGKFDSIIKNDLKLYSYAVQVPESVLGSDRGYAGASETQDDGFMRNIKSYQEQIGYILQTKIYDIVLLKYGITKPKYKLVWGTESIEQKNILRASYMSLLAMNIQLSPGMKKIYEKKLAELDGVDYNEIEKENDRLLRRENRNGKKDFNRQLQLKQLEQPKPGEPPIPPQTPPKPEEEEEEKIKHEIYKMISLGKAPQEIEAEIISEFRYDEDDAKDLVEDIFDNINEFIKKEGDKWCVYSHTTGKKLGTYNSKEEAEKAIARMGMFKNMKKNKENYFEECEHHITENFDNINIKEWLHIDFDKYKENIESVINKDEFNMLLAENKEEKKKGYLTKKEIEQLKIILINAIKNEKAIGEIKEEVKVKMNIRDLTEKVKLNAERRIDMIVKTELTRLMNKAIIEATNDYTLLYKWDAILDERICPICEELSGQIFDADTLTQDMVPPIHPNCRCSLDIEQVKAK